VLNLLSYGQRLCRRSKWLVLPTANTAQRSLGLGGRLTDAVIVLFKAAMVDVLTEDHKRRILIESGEMQRWEDCQAETPEDERVLYPPFFSICSGGVSLISDLIAEFEDSPVAAFPGKLGSLWNPGWDGIR
jgi:hypothetical protein